ncbi:TetR family transcriptional regulator [Chondromyces crocatus]|uniref:TetR family transcriptional regulator n=2 Tax=Chondromyces crocatus TaxID=52 RepID=A0A0K1EDV8_CHOCO|nr:TetR family transcriptional regulator [Chondromyces crocatus]
MGRPAGSRNPDFEATRASLLRGLLARVTEPDGARASLRELAAAAGVSASTLRHYFGSREGVLAAVFAHWHEGGRPYLLSVATEPLAPVRASLDGLLRRLGEAFDQHGVGEVFAVGLAVGLRQETLGPAYLQEVLDPLLEAVEARLARHVARGELRAGEVRHMALSLMSPPLLALLHQGALGGVACRPLSYTRFCDDHIAAFLRAHGTGHEAPAEPGARAPQSMAERARRALG